MAGDWIKMRSSLDTDPAVVRISSALKTDRFGVVGRLHKIWSWANEHLTDGQNVPVDAEFLDSLVQTPGFSAELRHVGWLSGRDGSLCFPGFERHNGESAKKRAQDAARKRRSRESEDSPQNVTQPSGQKRDQSREEKSRDIKSESAEAFPTLEQVREEFRKKGYRNDPDSFFSYWDSRNWTDSQMRPVKWQSLAWNQEVNPPNAITKQNQRRKGSSVTERNAENAKAFLEGEL